MGNDDQQETKNKKLYRQLLLLAMVVLLGSGYFLVKNLFIVITYHKTIATVIGVSELRSSGTNNSKSYIPTVSYKTKSGQNVTTKTFYGSSSFNFSRGDKLTVYYNPKEPYTFKISLFLSMWVLPIGGFLFGLLLVKGGFSIKNDELANNGLLD